MEPRYDFSHPLFKQMPHLVRLAKEHLSLASLRSEAITWEVAKTTDLGIPVVYHIHYHFKSIVGVGEDRMPLFGSHHIAEMTLERPYPLEPCKVYMKTDIWHPNVKWDGRLKGRVCSNVDKLGVAFDLYGLVLWVGEILQYKNYHAKNVPPYPEDINVAEWVLTFAEPQGIVDKEKGIFIDETPLLAGTPKPAAPAAKAQEPAPAPVATQPEMPPAAVVQEAPATPLQPMPKPKPEPAPPTEIGGSRFKITLTARKPVAAETPATTAGEGSEKFKIVPRSRG